MSRRSVVARPAVIFGGAGFIGTNLAHRLASQGRRVTVFDNLSRTGVYRNARWLSEKHPERVRIVIGDVRDAVAVRREVESASEVFQLAAQVAVTTSLEDPVHDFDVNVRGTLNVLEALRALDDPPPLVFTSTNKVYGALDDVPVLTRGQRYEPADEHVRAHGISEARPLEFHSPYGCSKGAADQYVLDYARSFGLRTVVFRMSCIYGPHQFGTEDQGWVAHFLIRALEGRPITLYGTGLQVRDVLFVDDLVNAFQLAVRHASQLSGTAFNMGGGPARTTSLLEVMELIRDVSARDVSHQFDEWRTGDQRYYVSDTRKFSEATGWEALVGVDEGVRALWRWLQESRGRRVEDAPRVTH